MTLSPEERERIYEEERARKEAQERLKQDETAAKKLEPTHSFAAARRSNHARTAFKHISPCPATGRPTGACPGYVIDHVIPLACGGLDAPSNMQWMTTADAKTKDRWERKDCTLPHHP